MYIILQYNPVIIMHEHTIHADRLIIHVSAQSVIEAHCCPHPDTRQSVHPKPTGAPRLSSKKATCTLSNIRPPLPQPALTSVRPVPECLSCSPCQTSLVYTNHESGLLSHANKTSRTSSFLRVASGSASGEISESRY